MVEEDLETYEDLLEKYGNERTAKRIYGLWLLYDMRLKDWEYTGLDNVRDACILVHEWWLGSKCMLTDKIGELYQHYCKLDDENQYLDFMEVVKSFKRTHPATYAERGLPMPFFIYADRKKWLRKAVFIK